MHNHTVGILLGQGGGLFAPVVAIPTDGVPTGLSTVTIADFNGDGNLDLAVANSDSNTVSILFGDGGGGFAAPSSISPWAVTGLFGVNAADVNGDGKPDLIASNFTANSVAVWRNIFDLTPVTLATPHLYNFDLSLDAFGTGEFNQGTANAFDGDGRLMVDGVPFTPDTQTFNMADGGQTLVTLPKPPSPGCWSIAGSPFPTPAMKILRERWMFSPTPPAATSRRRCRWSAIWVRTLPPRFSPLPPAIVLTPADQWFGTDNGAGNALIDCFRSFYGLTPTAVSVVGDNITWTYNLTCRPVKPES